MKNDIRNAMQSHLLSLVDVLETQLSNNTLTPAPADDVPYQICSFVGSDTTDLSLAFDNRKHIKAIFQINLMYPKNEWSAGALKEADRLIEHFKRGTIIDKNSVQVRITDTPEAIELGVTDNRFIVAVRVVYNAYNVV